MQSLKYSKEFVESCLHKLPLKDKEFLIYQPASDNDIPELKDCLNVAFDKNISDLDKAVDIEKFPKCSDFLKSKHIISR